MPNIIPVSDLRNYNAVIGQVSYDNPVYLTKNGRGDCAIVDIREYDELKALKGLFSELEKGEMSARKDGWISLEEAEEKLGL
ncbi:MAG: type II toxin-antitoxin system prevent-host-death family antitoxin [Lachnospiraceae bacterium]|nr:type II toxin-antitoxin system prevent-host-death family antitoxin [Lachnospiraceae bacterium]